MFKREILVELGKWKKKQFRKPLVIRGVRQVGKTTVPAFLHNQLTAQFKKNGSREMREAFRALEKTMLIRIVYPSITLEVPVSPSLKRKPRLHVLDTGKTFDPMIFLLNKRHKMVRLKYVNGDLKYSP